MDAGKYREDPPDEPADDATEWHAPGARLLAEFGGGPNWTAEKAERHEAWLAYGRKPWWWQMLHRPPGGWRL